MKRILMVICLTAAAAAAEAGTNTNLVAWARTLALNTNGLILFPTNFIDANSLSSTTNDAAMQLQITSNYNLLVLANTTQDAACAAYTTAHAVAFSSYTGANAAVISALATQIYALQTSLAAISVSGVFPSYADLQAQKQLLQSQMTNQTVLFSNTFSNVWYFATNADAVADAAYTLANNAHSDAATAQSTADHAQGDVDNLYDTMSIINTKATNALGVANAAVRRSGDTMTGNLYGPGIFGLEVYCSNRPVVVWEYNHEPANSNDEKVPNAINAGSSGYLYFMSGPGGYWKQVLPTGWY